MAPLSSGKKFAAAGSKGKTIRSRRVSGVSKKIPEEEAPSLPTRRSARIENMRIMKAKAKQPCDIEMVRTVESLDGNCVVYKVREDYKLLFMASLGLFQKTGDGENDQDFYSKNEALKEKIKNFNYLDAISNEPSPPFESFGDAKGNEIIEYITIEDDKEDQYAWNSWTPHLTFPEEAPTPATQKEIAEAVEKLKRVVQIKQWSMFRKKISKNPKSSQSAERT